MNNKQIKTSSKSTQTYSRRIRWGRVISYAILIAFALVYIGPILMLVNTAFNTLPQFMVNPTAPVKELAFQNFIDAWEKLIFHNI